MMRQSNRSRHNDRGRGERSSSSFLGRRGPPPVGVAPSDRENLVELTTIEPHTAALRAEVDLHRWRSDIVGVSPHAGQLHQRPPIADTGSLGSCSARNSPRSARVRSEHLGLQPYGSPRTARRRGGRPPGRALSAKLEISSRVHTWHTSDVRPTTPVTSAKTPMVISSTPSRPGTRSPQLRYRARSPCG